MKLRVESHLHHMPRFTSHLHFESWEKPVDSAPASGCEHAALNFQLSTLNSPP